MPQRGKPRPRRTAAPLLVLATLAASAAEETSDAPDADTYDLARSAGPARGDIGAWGVAVDLGGDDRYVIPRGAGRASRDGLAVFLDAAGADTYEQTPTKDDNAPADGQTFTQGAGGLFADRAE